jgi:hypothetical protein
LSSAEKFKGNDIMITRVEIINDPIAYGAALKTKSKFFRTVSPANKNIKMILKSF